MERRLLGWVRLRLTSADCAGRMREISSRFRLENIVFDGVVTAEFEVLRRDLKRIPIRDGEHLEVVTSGGMPRLLAWLWSWRIVAAMVASICTLTMFLSTRVLFFRVEGNGELPARRILEEAERCGLYFGAPRREIRSEQVKNHLLYAIPELRWAGVNTDGCTAVITVSLRDPAEEPAQEIPGHVVAAADALVTQVVAGKGTALVQPGQAVREGQILISGLTDLGICTRLDRAEGEVYGLTRREITVQLPEKRMLRGDCGAVVKKFSLRIGKKCVNFSNDSGILHGTCVKMRTVNYLTLPGGFRLPAALVTETYSLCRTREVNRAEAADILLDAARDRVREEMTAGVILEEDCTPTGTRLEAAFGCREMIGRFRPAILTEGDTNDRENGERGAG